MFAVYIRCNADCIVKVVCSYVYSKVIFNVKGELSTHVLTVNNEVGAHAVEDVALDVDVTLNLIIVVFGNAVCMEEVHGMLVVLVCCKCVETCINIVVFKGKAAEGICEPANHVPGAFTAGTGLVTVLMQNVVLVNELTVSAVGVFLIALKLERTVCAAAKIMPCSEVGILDGEYPCVCR